MSKIDKKKLEKAISICDKQTATLEEIFEGCGIVCLVMVADKPRGGYRKGLLSCSYTPKGKELAICLWQKNKKKGKFKRVSHFGMNLGDMIILRGFIDLVININFRSKFGIVQNG